MFVNDNGLPARGRDDSIAAHIASEGLIALRLAHGDHLPRLSTPCKRGAFGRNHRISRQPQPQPSAPAAASTATGLHIMSARVLPRRLGQSGMPLHSFFSPFLARQYHHHGGKLTTTSPRRTAPSDPLGLLHIAPMHFPPQCVFWRERERRGPHQPHLGPVPAEERA